MANRVWIDIEDPSGNRLGSGPITSALSVSIGAKLDASGDFRFVVPVAETQRGIIQKKNIARFKMLLGNDIVEVGAGIIDKIEHIVAGRSIMLSVTGNDLLHELSYRSVRNLTIGAESSPATNGPSEIMTYAPSGWSLDTTNGYSTTAKAVYHAFSGESVLEALVRLAELTGEHFRLGSGRKVIWMRNDAPQSQMRAVQGSGVEIESNPYALVIQELDEVEDASELASRIIPYGSGTGESELTLSGSTWTPPSGYTIDTSNNYIRRDWTESTYGQIERVMRFNDITTPNMLAEQAYEWLKRHSSAEKYYRIRAIKSVPTALNVGEALKVEYRRVMTDMGKVYEIDDTLRVLEVIKETSAEGRLLTLQLATIDRYPQSEEEKISEIFTNMNRVKSHNQTPSSHTHSGDQITYDATIEHVGGTTPRILRVRENGNNWIAEVFITGVTLAAGTYTNIDTGIDYDMYGTSTRGQYKIFGMIAGDDSVSNLQNAIFECYVRLTTGFSQNGGSLLQRTSSLFFNSVGWDTSDTSNIRFRISNSSTDDLIACTIWLMLMKQPL